jgi:peptidyl-prolyl cis-trans isomerase SurA
MKLQILEPLQRKRENRVLRRIVPLIVFFLWSFCCANAGAEELIDRIVAVVNNEVITLSDLNKVTTLMFAGVDKKQAFTDEQRAEIEQKALEQLIEKKLIEQKAKESSIKVDDKEVSRAVEDVLKKNNISLEQLKEILKKDGTSIEEYRKMLRSEILQSKVIGREVRSKITITDKDIQEYYEKNVKHQEKPGEKVRIQQIFFATPPDTTPKQVEKLTSQLEEIRAKIMAGDDFGQMAAKHSQDPSAKEGGDLGVFGRGELLPVIENVAFSLQAGEVSQVTRTPAGLHLIKVIDKKGTAGEKGAQSSRDEIEENLYRREVDVLFLKWMEELKKKAYIKTYL